MALTLKGSWPAPLPIVIRWLADHDMKVLTEVPENLSDSLPVVVVSLAPGGSLDVGTYTSAPSLDVDVFAADHDSQDELTCRLTAALSTLQGAGNQYGYVDSSTLTSFSEIADDDPTVLRCTATVTLSLRPQNINI